MVVLKGPRFQNREWAQLNATERQSIKDELMGLLAEEIANIEDAVNELFTKNDVPIRIRLSPTIEETH